MVSALNAEERKCTQFGHYWPDDSKNKKTR